MKISNKISSFILFLLVVLCVNTVVGLSQLSKIGQELNKVVKKDVAITSAVTSVAQHQFEKALLVERIIRIAEELAFEDMIPARREYLLYHIELIQQGFDKLNASISGDILKAQEVIEKGIKAEAKPSLKKTELVEASKFLKDIEDSHNYYKALNKKFIKLVSSENYQVSLGEIDQINQAEKKVTRKAKDLVESMKQFIANSLSRAKYEEKAAREILWLSFYISMFVSIIIAYSIIRSILKPLKVLVNAAQQIGEGDFVVSLNDGSKDEIGDVSKAFNKMAKRLGELNAELENKNKALSEHLKTTKEQKMDLEKVNKELDRFVHTVSHDIRAPLTGIIGYGTFLNNQHKDKLDPKAQRCIEGIFKGADRLKKLIEDLLELTRISRIKNPYRSVDISEIIKSVAERLDFMMLENNVKLQVQEDMPDITCDHIKMEEVFFNLISNAIKFSSKIEGSIPEINIGCKEKRDYYEFFVKDNGIGIKAEDQDKIFEIFTKLHNSIEYEGTGTGLAIVKGVILDHNGEIRVESKEGEGSTFYFTISKNLLVK
ncbi:MAG: ATP-binding protein [Candidatus Zapsychrus exili]|nr:ATP-binding protein [Candidatus Zapsychrus exili]